MSSVRRLGLASIATARNARLAALVAAASLLNCATPTEVIVEIFTDLPCDKIKAVEVTVGSLETYEAKEPASTSDPKKCFKDDNGYSQLGSVVLIPSGPKDGDFAVKVVASVDTPIEDCGKDDKYAGCIVARRSLRFIPKSDLKLPIFLSSSCEGVGCTVRSGETCVLGACVPAEVKDPAICELPGVCSDDVLTDTNTPLDQDVGQCGSPSVIIDDFTTETAMSHWNIEGPLTAAAQVDGALVLNLPKNAAQSTEVRYRSDHAVNLKDDAIKVKVPLMLNTASEARAYFAAEFDEQNQLRIEQQKGQLRFLGTAAGAVVSDTSTPYKLEEHVWWEFRATDEYVLMRTSMDGFDWDLQAKVPLAPVAPFIDRVKIVLGAAADKPEASPGLVSFDNVNQGREPAPWCAAEAIADTFDGSAPASKWRINKGNQACSMTQTGDGVSFTMKETADMSVGCSYESFAAFDFTGKSIVLGLESFSLTEPGIDFFLRVEDDNTGLAEVGVRVSDDGAFMGAKPLVGFQVKRPIGKAEVEFEGKAYKFFRIYERAGELYWQMAETADAAADSWKLIATGPPGFNTKAARVSFGFSAPYYVLTVPVTVEVADISVTESPPPPP